MGLSQLRTFQKLINKIICTNFEALLIEVCLKISSLASICFFKFQDKILLVVKYMYICIFKKSLNEGNSINFF